MKGRVACPIFQINQAVDLSTQGRQLNRGPRLAIVVAGALAVARALVVARALLVAGATPRCVGGMIWPFACRLLLDVAPD